MSALISNDRIDLTTENLTLHDKHESITKCWRWPKRDQNTSFYSTTPAMNIETFDLALKAENGRTVIDSCESCMKPLPMLVPTRYVMLNQTDLQSFALVAL